MITDTTIYGYLFDGYLLHPYCVNDTADIKAVNDGIAGRLYSIDDTDPEGLTCDNCGNWIFEPDYRELALRGIEELLFDSGVVSWRLAGSILSYLESEHGFNPSHNWRTAKRV